MNDTEHIVDREFKMEEFMLLTQQLERFHGIFSQLWQLGKPIFSTKIPTACVEFDPEGDCILFLCNPDFWDSCSFDKKLFVICHECLHVLLNHGKRSLFLREERTSTNEQEDATLVNKAMDVVINELLIAKYGFMQSSIDPKKEYCWIDTVFGEDWSTKVSYDCSFEHYYDVLKRNKPRNTPQSSKSGSPGGVGGSGQEPQTVDDHSGLESFAQKDQIDRKIKEAIDQLSEQEKEDLKKQIDKVISNASPSQDGAGMGGKEAGTGAGGGIRQMLLPKVKKKRK